MSQSTSFDELQLFDEANFLFDAFDPFKDCDGKDDPLHMSQAFLSQSWGSSRDSITAMPLLSVNAENISKDHLTLASQSNAETGDHFDSSLAYLTMYNSHSYTFSNLSANVKTHANANAKTNTHANATKSHAHAKTNASTNTTLHKHSSSHSYSKSQTKPQSHSQSHSHSHSRSQSQSQSHFSYITEPSSLQGDTHAVYPAPLQTQPFDLPPAYSMPLPNRPLSASPLVMSRNPMPVVEATPGYQMILPAQSSFLSDFRMGSPVPSTTSSRKEPDNDSLLSRSPSLFSIGSPTPSFTGSTSEQSLTKRDRNRMAAEKCRKKKHELIASLTLENEILQQKKIELEKSNQALEQRLDYLINVMASYGIAIPPNKNNH